MVNEKRTPTVADVAAEPKYWIRGPGYETARKTRCPHDYFLTDSCPGCDVDNEGKPDLGVQVATIMETRHVHVTVIADDGDHDIAVDLVRQYSDDRNRMRVLGPAISAWQIEAVTLDGDERRAVDGFWPEDWPDWMRWFIARYVHSWTHR